jgi:hypothetical protein
MVESAAGKPRAEVIVEPVEKRRRLRAGDTYRGDDRVIFPGVVIEVQLEGEPIWQRSIYQNHVVFGGIFSILNRHYAEKIEAAELKARQVADATNITNPPKE